MAKDYIVETALLAQGWVRDVRVTVADDGMITALSPAPPSPASALPSPVAGAPPPPPARRVAGVVIPGMANAHSHAFQRALVGRTEYRTSTSDSFWTWRNAMYALANRLEPDDLEVLAAQLFVEMLKAGYTSVAEFHYVHRRPDGAHYPQRHGLWEAVARAAHDAGIGLTLLPTLYQHSDFGGLPLRKDQSRFALDTDWFVRAVQERVQAQRSRSSLQRTGAAFHSLRAVSLDTLRAAGAALRDVDAHLPLHIHVAEQLQEVETCLRHTGRRPIELLLEAGMLDAHWCLVHATHATPAELAGIAASSAAVCVSISTEANLGDGFFDTDRFLNAGGRLCVGSDSQATVCPAEELRWMEYQMRLRHTRRGVLASDTEAHVGTRLWREAARNGADAIGQPSGAIAVGRRADWMVLDAAHPSLAGAGLEHVLDHVVFGGGSAAIRDVMVGGHWVVENRQHALDASLQGRFAKLMQRLA